MSPTIDSCGNLNNQKSVKTIKTITLQVPSKPSKRVLPVPDQMHLMTSILMPLTRHLATKEVVRHKLTETCQNNQTKQTTNKKKIFFQSTTNKRLRVLLWWKC